MAITNFETEYHVMRNEVNTFLRDEGGIMRKVSGFIMQTDDELFFTGFTYLTEGLFNTVILSRRWMELSFPLDYNEQFYLEYFSL